MKTFAVDLHSIRLYVRTGDAYETLNFRTKRQADKRILKLLERGYSLDRTGAQSLPNACEECGMVHAPHANSLCSQ